LSTNERSDGANPLTAKSTAELSFGGRHSSLAQRHIGIVTAGVAGCRHGTHARG
jgi:hypothetical protein